MVKNNKKILSSIIIVLVVALSTFYCYMAVGFANAVVKTVEGIDNAKKQWKSEGVNPIDSMKNQIKEAATKLANAKKITNGCDIVEILIHKECVISNARLNAPKLKQINFVVPLNQDSLHCDSLNFDEKEINIYHESVNIDSVKHIKSTPDNPVRTFYVLEHQNKDTEKAIELFYSPSGSIFRIEAKNNNGNWSIKDFFCAKY